MAHSTDVIIIGGGHNGLVAAAYLAKAGRKVLVLERRDQIGGALATEEVFPGFKFDVFPRGAGWISPDIWRDLDLGKHGLEIIEPEVTVFTPLTDGRGLSLWRDPTRSIRNIAAFSQRDGERWTEFGAAVQRITSVLADLYGMIPPDPAADAGDLMQYIGLALKVRQLPGRQMMEILRTLPMPIYEYLNEWFESEPLKATLAASGITDLMLGPRGAGTAYNFLHQHVGSPAGVFRPSRQVQGGISRLAEALAGAARQAGAEIRTGVEVAQVLITEGRATGVALADGTEITAKGVISNADPKRTFLTLVDAGVLDPTFLRRIGNIKYRGMAAVVNIALDGLPEFPAAQGDIECLRGAISISPDMDTLEHAYDAAKYGGGSPEPYLEASIPSLNDPSLAPPGQHVMNVWVQYAPYHLKSGRWDQKAADALGKRVLETLARYAPDIKKKALHVRVLTPRDFEDHYGLTEGSFTHGLLMLDQFMFMRPVAGMSAYQSPIPNLYLCGAGTHPGGGITGMSGRNAAREVLK
jgi:phytoene dehydrogenase-like protein